MLYSHAEHDPEIIYKQSMKLSWGSLFSLFRKSNNLVVEYIYIYRCLCNKYYLYDISLYTNMDDQTRAMPMFN